MNHASDLGNWVLAQDYMGIAYLYSELLAGGLRPQGGKDDRASQGGHPGDSQRMVHHGPDESGVALVIETF